MTKSIQKNNNQIILNEQISNQFLGLLKFFVSCLLVFINSVAQSTVVVY